MKRNHVILLVFTFLLMLSLAGCSKKDPVEPVESTDVYGSTEETSEEETTKDIFAVDNPNIAGYEIRESTASTHNTEEDRKIEFNAPDETTVAEDTLTEEELAEEWIMENTYTHPITGEFLNRTELNNIYNMQYEAKELWEPEFDAGRVDKATVEKFFNYVYEDVDKTARDKVIQEILSPNIKVEFKEPEKWPLEETDPEEEYETDEEENWKETIQDDNSIVGQRWADAPLESNGSAGRIDGEGLTTGDLSPYTPD